MNTRRTFLKTAAAACAAGVVSRLPAVCSAEEEPLVVGDARVVRFRDPQLDATDTYLEITSRSGLKGHAGPLLREQAAALPANLARLLAGRDAREPAALAFDGLWNACHPGKPLDAYAQGMDPLTGSRVWDIERAARHTATGWLITALSAVDLALWDLRGKAAGLPVWRLLGSDRPRLDAYASMLGYSVVPGEAAKIAREFFDQGFTCQKWFFDNGLTDGAGGLKQNIELVRSLREELGPAATLMFDGIQYVWKKSTDVDYAIALAKGIVPYNPHWLEEPLRPDDLEGYTRLKGETGIALASGEHWYTRWNVRPFLDRKIVSFVQSDPEWCGGISEWLEICRLVNAHPGVQVVPHGHHVLAASACVASQPESLCPMLEYLVRSRVRFQHCQTRPVIARAGAFEMPDETGLGPPLDEQRLERLT
ncbi:MAG: enolase C-terminal domain-like protein [Thermoguttaceae bacterium]